MSETAIAEYEQNFDKDPKNALAQNVCTRTELLDVLRKRTVHEGTRHVFTHKVIHQAQSQCLIGMAGLEVLFGSSPEASHYHNRQN